MQHLLVCPDRKEVFLDTLAGSHLLHAVLGRQIVMYQFGHRKDAHARCAKRLEQGAVFELATTCGLMAMRSNHWSIRARTAAWVVGSSTGTLAKDCGKPRRSAADSDAGAYLADALGSRGIAIGSHGLTAAESLLPGSVTCKVVHLARLPVLIVR